MRATLKYPPVRFTLEQIKCIARGFARAIGQFQIELFACAILWDHVHIVVDRHDATIEYLVGVLKRAASRQLTSESLHPLMSCRRSDSTIPSPWVAGGWNRFLDDRSAIDGAIGYTNLNPIKHGMQPQEWEFVRSKRA